MDMKKTLATLAILSLMGGAAALPAYAQVTGKKPSSANYTWPRTSGGQSDFEFSKQEVLQEKTVEAGRNGLPAPSVPKIADLLNDEVITLIPRVTVSATTATSGTSATDSLPVLDRLRAMDIDIGALPSLTTVATVDMSEFKANIERAVEHEVATYQPQPGQYSLEHLMRGLVLQAVVTSPHKYAVINGQQYKEGESLQVPVRLGPTDLDFIKLLQAQLPAPGTLSPAQMAAYEEVYEEAIAGLAALRQNNPNALTREFPMPALVVEIRNRTVVLDFNGQRHELGIKYAY
jgi:hypothetical protein